MENIRKNRIQNHIWTFLIVFGLMFAFATTASASIKLSTELKEGAMGNEVLLVQKRLVALGYSTVECNSIYEKKTVAAVIAFQKNNGYTGNGIVAQQLFDYMMSSKARPKNKYKMMASVQVNQQLAGKTIFLDAGHGGKDVGATRGKIYEKNINLDVAKKIKVLLEKAGATVVMTRPDDKYYSLFYRSVLPNKSIIDKEIALLRQKVDMDLAQKQKNDEQVKTQTADLANKQRTYENVQTKLNMYLQQYSETITKTDDVLKKLVESGNEYLSLKTKIKSVRASLTKLTESNMALDKTIINNRAIIAKYGQSVQLMMSHINDIGSKDRDGIYDLDLGKTANQQLKFVFDTEKKYAQNTIFLSVHVNSTGDKDQSSASGINVYWRNNGQKGYVFENYYKGYDEQKRSLLASSLLEKLNVNTEFPKKNKKTKTNDYSVLRENNLVSSLIEVGFLNNPTDRNLLQIESFKENVATGVYDGVLDYFEKITKSGATTTTPGGIDINKTPPAGIDVKPVQPNGSGSMTSMTPNGSSTTSQAITTPTSIDTIPLQKP